MLSIQEVCIVSQGFEVTMELLWRPILLHYGDIWSETFVGFGNFFPDTSKTSLLQLSPYAVVTVTRNSMELRSVEFEKIGDEAKSAVQVLLPMWKYRTQPKH